MYQVKKKNGSLEDFDRSKVIRGAINAGASQEEAERVAAAVESWLPTAAAVDVGAVRTKVIETLKTINPTVATSFESYQKPAAEAPVQPNTETASPLVQPVPPAPEPETQPLSPEPGIAKPEAKPEVEAKTEENI